MRTIHPPASVVGAARMVRRVWIPLTVVALALLVIVMSSPAWAATAPNPIEQGTVPPPPPGGGAGGGGDQGGEGSERPTVTPTPFAPGAVEALSMAAGTPVAPANYRGVVTAPRLNMRSGPGVGYGVVGQVQAEQVLTLQYRDPSGQWWFTCCLTDTITSGWVSALFIRPEFDNSQALAMLPLFPGLSPATAPVAADAAGALAASPAPGSRAGVIAVPRLNLRDQPTTAGTILAKLLAGEIVNIFSRNAAGDWWYLCCAAGTTTEGWASAEFINPGFDRTQSTSLLPVFGEQVRAILPTPTPRPPRLPATALPAVSAALTGTDSITLTLPVSEATPATTTLSVLMWQEPPFAVQGEPLTLHFVISNTGSYTATGVELRDQLTSTLRLGEIRTGSASQVTGSGTSGPVGTQEIFTIGWPRIAPQEAVTASVIVTPAVELASGAVIENLAAVTASNAAPLSTGISIGLPPAALPEFQ